MSTPLWRQAFDALERPLASASEAWLQSDTVMDVTAVGFKVQRRLQAKVERAVGSSLGFWGLPTRRDLTALVNQVASLERQIRELAGEAEHGNGSPVRRPVRQGGE